MVSPFSVSIFVIVLELWSKPPINMTPRGEAQALCPRLLMDRLWDCSQLPVLERVWQVVQAAESPSPPHAVSPVCECWYLVKGREGREQILDPLV